MRLELFNFIDETIDILEKNMPTYIYLEGIIKKTFLEIVEATDDITVGVKSRIKGKDSLKEKIIRNHFYSDFKDGEEAIDNLSDLIGLTIDCRFISEEQQIYKKLFEYFEASDDEYYICTLNKDIRLNLRMPQPQVQRNGFTIYRMDGHIMFNDKKVNYELQIKSLVHSFWSEIEHQVVYKNTQFVVYDSFMKNLLGTIRDNLDVVDRQLEIVYKQITEQTVNNQDIGMTQESFKTFIAKSINDLVALKMYDTVGFTTDFRKSSAILSQYIYIKDFVNAENPDLKMIDYFQQLNLLKISDIDFTMPIYLNKPFESNDKFCDVVGKYWEKQLNTNYEWHVFFVMLFALEPGDNSQDFTQFVEIIKNLIIPHRWYMERFKDYGASDSIKARDLIDESLGNELIKINKIDIIHEDKLIELMDFMHDFIIYIESNYTSYDEIVKGKEYMLKTLRHKVENIFK